MISELTLAAVKAEAMAQDVKWGEQNHEPEIWLAILVEEVGELAQAMLADRFAATEPGMHDSHHDSMEIEAIQVAAVTCQFVEFLARRKTGMAALIGAIHPIGCHGAAQHTYTTACDGFHEPGQCPTSERPTRHVVTDDDDPWAEANAAGAL